MLSSKAEIVTGCSVLQIPVPLGLKVKVAGENDNSISETVVSVSSTRVTVTVPLGSAVSFIAICTLSPSAIVTASGREAIPPVSSSLT